MIFKFSISDLSTFLGKSPVTIRAWERKGFIERMERVGMDRSLGTRDVLVIAATAHRAGRISDKRYELIGDAIGSMSLIEQDNV